MKTNQSGRSMIEMLGVLAIIGVLSVGGIAGYSKAMTKYRSNKIIEQVSMLITNIRTMYAQQQTYYGLNNRTAINMGLVPDEMIVTAVEDEKTVQTGALKNVFGGAVQVLESSVDGDEKKDDKSAFIVSVFNISRDACVAIANSDWGTGSSSGLLGMHIYVPATAVKVDDTKVAALTGDNETVSVTSIDTAGAGMKKGDEGSMTNGFAFPGDTTLSVPMRATQATILCNCPTASDCAVTWKSY